MFNQHNYLASTLRFIILSFARFIFLFLEIVTHSVYQCTVALVYTLWLGNDLKLRVSTDLQCVPTYLPSAKQLLKTSRTFATILIFTRVFITLTVFIYLTYYKNANKKNRIATGEIRPCMQDTQRRRKIVCESYITEEKIWDVGRYKQLSEEEWDLTRRVKAKMPPMHSNYSIELFF